MFCFIKRGYLSYNNRVQINLKVFLKLRKHSGHNIQIVRTKRKTFQVLNRNNSFIVNLRNSKCSKNDNIWTCILEAGEVKEDGDRGLNIIEDFETLTFLCISFNF